MGAPAGGVARAGGVDWREGGGVRAEDHYGKTLLVAEVCRCSEGVDEWALAEVCMTLRQADAQAQAQADQRVVGDAHVCQTHVMLRT